MFRRLHIHMTLFSTLITGGILSLMAVACLLITENNIRQNYYTIFTNNAYSCISSYYKVVAFIVPLQGLYAILLEILWIVSVLLPLDGFR